MGIYSFLLIMGKLTLGKYRIAILCTLQCVNRVKIRLAGGDGRNDWRPRCNCAWLRVLLHPRSCSLGMRESAGVS